MKRYFTPFVLFLAILCITGCGEKKTTVPIEMEASEIYAATAASETTITELVETTHLTEAVESSQTNETLAALNEELVLAYSQRDGSVYYYYDTKGRLVYKENLAVAATTEYVYGEGDQLVTENYHGLVHYSTEYDSHGNPDQRYQFLGLDGSGDKVLNIDYTNKYDDLGRISETVEDYYIESEIDWRRIWCYNYFVDGGYSVDERVFSFDDGVASESEHTVTYYNSERQPVIEAFVQGETEILFHEIEYDEYGNIQTDTYVSYNPGEPDPRQLDIYRYKNAYNDDGQLVQKIREYSEISIVDGIVSETPATIDAFYVYEYDDAGNLILERITYCDNYFMHENVYRYVPLSEALYESKIAAIE